MGDLLCVKLYAVLWQTTDRELDDEIGEFKRGEPVIFLKHAGDEWSQVLTRLGVGYIASSDLTADP